MLKRFRLPVCSGARRQRLCPHPRLRKARTGPRFHRTKHRRVGQSADGDQSADHHDDQSGGRAADVLGDGCHRYERREGADF